MCTLYPRAGMLLKNNYLLSSYHVLLVLVRILVPGILYYNKLGNGEQLFMGQRSKTGTPGPFGAKNR